MRISSNVTPRGDVYYFRMRVPAHLIEAYDLAPEKRTP